MRKLLRSRRVRCRLIGFRSKSVDCGSPVVLPGGQLLTVPLRARPHVQAAPEAPVCIHQSIVIIDVPIDADEGSLSTLFRTGISFGDEGRFRAHACHSSDKSDWVLSADVVEQAPGDGRPCPESWPDRLAGNNAVKAENCVTWQRTGDKNFLMSASIRITKM